MSAESGLHHRPKKPEHLSRELNDERRDGPSRGELSHWWTKWVRQWILAPVQACWMGQP